MVVDSGGLIAVGKQEAAIVVRSLDTKGVAAERRQVAAATAVVELSIEVEEVAAEWTPGRPEDLPALLFPRLRGS